MAEDLRYIYSSARVKVLETKLLRKDIFARMADANNFESALKILADAGVFRYDISNIKNVLDLDNFISTEIENLYQLTQELFKDNFLIDAYWNLKTDIANCYKLICRAKSPMLIDFIKQYIDLYNIKTFLRLSVQGKNIIDIEKYLIDNGYISKKDACFYFSKKNYGKYSVFISKGIIKIEEEKSFALLEYEMDEYLLDQIKKAKLHFFGPEAVFGYFYARESELEKIRLILFNKINNVRKDIINERLISNYA